MLKKNKWNFILSSIVILLPIAFGLAMWNRLPASIITHWGADGAADGWSGRGFSVFGLPLIVLCLHIFAVLVTCRDNKYTDQSKKAIGIVFWICPMISVLANAFIYCAALGITPSVKYVTIPIGLMFVMLGNYMPKFKPNNTMGIRLPWTLANEQVWSRTHRLGGILWVIAGVIIMASALFSSAVMFIVIPVVLLVSILIPAAYSYSLYKKLGADEKITQTAASTVRSNRISLCIALAILAVVGIIMFTGDITYEYGEDSFSADSVYSDKLVLEYDAIDSIEYREQCDVGERTFGFGSARLQIGTFRNDEFGLYTLYSYTACDSCVVLTVGDETLMLSGIDSEATLAVYNELCSRLGQ